MEKEDSFEDLDWSWEDGWRSDGLFDNISQTDLDHLGVEVPGQFPMDSLRMGAPIPHQYAPHHPHQTSSQGRAQDASTGYELEFVCQGSKFMSAPGYSGPMDFTPEIPAMVMQPVPDWMQSPMFLPPTVGAQSNRRPLKDGWTMDEDNLLLSLRKEGWEYSQIAEEMRTKLGVDKTENCLVKRLQKIQEQYLEPLPKAVKNAMPKIMNSIKYQIEIMGLDASGKDKEVVDQIMAELPRMFPKFVQNKLLSKRKALLNTSLTRT